MSVGTPFQCGASTAKKLPDIKISGKLIIRIASTTPTDQVAFKLKSDKTVSAAHADGFLNAGESVEICGQTLKNAADVEIIPLSGNPLIYWFDN